MQLDAIKSFNWTMEPRPLYSRYAEIPLVEALADSPAAPVHGPRQSGKTTLVHLVGEEPLDLAYETLTDRSCTYMDSVSEVDDDYEIQVEDYWHTHTDPETGRTLVDGGEEDLWAISYFVGTEGDEVGEEGVDGVLEIVGLLVEELAQEVIARRREETGVQDPEAAGETIWAVRKAIAIALIHEY